MKKWFGLITKIALFLTAFFAIILTVFVNMGGNSQTLKLAISDYISVSSGMRAEVGTLHKMTFFPAVTIDIADIELHKDDDKIAEGRIDNALFQIGFWDVLTRSGKLQNLQIENASFLPGTLNAQSVEIARIGIDETPAGENFLAAHGKIGPHKITAEIALAHKGKNFTLPKDGDINLEIGTITANGIIRPRNIGGFHIRDFTAAHNGIEVLSGAFTFIRNRNAGITIRGDAKAAQHKTETEMDINIDGNMLNGTLNAYRFDMADFEPNSNLIRALNAWNEMLALNHNPLDINLELTAQNYTNNGQNQTNAALILKRENGMLKTLKQTTE